MARQRCAPAWQRGRRGVDAAGKTANWQGIVKRRGEKLAILNFGTLMQKRRKSLNR